MHPKLHDILSVIVFKHTCHSKATSTGGALLSISSKKQIWPSLTWGTGRWRNTRNHKPAGKENVGPQKWRKTASFCHERTHDNDISSTPWLSLAYADSKKTHKNVDNACHCPILLTFFFHSLPLTVSDVNINKHMLQQSQCSLADSLLFCVFSLSFKWSAHILPNTTLTLTVWQCKMCNMHMGCFHQFGLNQFS